MEKLIAIRDFFDKGCQADFKFIRIIYAQI